MIILNRSLNSDQLLRDKVKIFQITDESLNQLGNVLRNDKTRRIILLLIKEEMYVNQIAEKLKIGVNVVSDNMKQLRTLGLIDVKQKPISRKTKDHNFYKFKTDIFISIVPKENKIKSIFKESVKFVAIGIVALFSLKFKGLFQNTDGFTGTSQTYEIPLIIIIIGLSILLIKKR